MEKSPEVAMLDLNPQVIKKDGKKEFVILPYEEFVRIQEQLEDYEDLQILRQATEKEREDPTIGLEEAKRKFDLD
jgi:PHD/YefM family antitoxin component YafN of YafNO toxin-antitoxin module